MTKYITSYKELLAQCEAERAAAAEIKALPELTGSEKQIAWALDIRARKFAALNEMLASMTTTDEQLRRKNQIAIQATKNVLASKTESRFWIDNRNTPARKLIAANNMQDELKAEFEKLTAQATTAEVAPDEYAVSVESQDIAIDAEISAATATNTNDEHEQEAITMKTTIETKTAKNGTIKVKINGQRSSVKVAEQIIGDAARNFDTYTGGIEIRTDYGKTFAGAIIENTNAASMTFDEKGLVLFDELGNEYGYSCISTFLKRIATGKLGGIIIREARSIDFTLAAETDGTEDDPDNFDADDDNNDVFTLIPDADELNDVSETISDAEEIKVAAATATDAPKMAEVRIGDDIITYENGKCASVQSLKYGGLIEFENGETRWFTNPKRDNGGFYFDDLDQWDEGDFILEMIVRGACYHWDEEERFRPFLEAMGRGACTIDEPEPPVDDFAAKLAELQAKRDAAQAALLRAQEEHESAENALKNFLTDTAADLTTKLQTIKFDYRIKLIKKSCWTFSTTNFDDVYISAYRIGCGVEFHFETWIGKTLARYDTPAQVGKVIDMLREAIERGETEFKFPTVDELNQPPIDDCAVTAEAQDAATAAEIYNAEFAELRSLSDVELWNEQSKARANKDERRLAIVNDALEEMWQEELEAFKRLEAEPPKVPTCKEIFADLPADPNADKPNMARYITTATYVKHGQKTSLPSCSIGIRSTDFARAEKARLALKAALDGLDGTEIDIVTDPHIDLYPVVFIPDKSDEVIPVDYVDELDGTEDDAEDVLAIDVMPIDDSDDDELIDAPEIVDKTALEDSLTRAMKIALERLQAFCRAKNLTGASNELKLYNICSKAISELWGR